MNKKPSQNFILIFSISFAAFFITVLGFVTWVDPYRNLNAPWAMDFVSDRNIAYKRLLLMRENKSYTDLVVGSSTSEVFRTDALKNLFNREAFIASNGGAGAALRYLIIKDALEKNPRLERIIYIADLFELKDLFLYNEVYFQSEFQKLLEPADYELLETPGPLSRLNDFMSRKIVDRAFRTLSDYKKHKKGQFVSEFSADGTTKNSMVLVKPSEPFPSRVHRTATEHDYLYKDMTDVHSPSLKMIAKTVSLVKNYPKVRMDIVLAPVHPDYFKHFRSKFVDAKLYQKWTDFIINQAGNNVRVFDYSYPKYLEKNISGDEFFWNDGVHFNENTMEVIIKDIYTSK